MGMITLYEGNGGSQNPINTVEDTAGQDFYPSKNDEARSLTLRSVRPGCIIRVYDSKSASTGDDWCQITVKKSHDNYIVGSFQQNVNDDYVKVEYFKNNGLDGKVSRVMVK